MKSNGKEDRVASQTQLGWAPSGVVYIVDPTSFARLRNCPRPKPCGASESRNIKTHEFDRGGIDEKTNNNTLGRSVLEAI